MRPYTEATGTASKAQGVPGGPLATVLQAMRRLERGRSPEDVLTRAVGKTMARKVVDLARRVRLREIQSPDGQGGRYTRRAIFEPDYVHDAEAKHLRKLAAVLLSVVSWMGPHARTGHQAQGHSLNLSRLGRYHDLSRSELGRYLVLLQDAGILRRKQPLPVRDKLTGQIVTESCGTHGPSGHAYNVYQLVGGLPEELEKQLRRYHYRWWPRDRSELTENAQRAAQEVYAAMDDDEAMQATLRFVESLGRS